MGLHCKAYITLTECAKHIPVEVPNNWARVTYLLDSFKTINPSVLAAMAAVRQDDADKRVNFENAFTFLVPSCLVAAKVAKKGRVSFEANVSGTEGKPYQGGLVGIVTSLERGRKGLPFVITSLQSLRCYLKTNKTNSPNGTRPMMGARTKAMRRAMVLHLVAAPAANPTITRSLRA
jgi:hypothetical protein